MTAGQTLPVAPYAVAEPSGGGRLHREAPPAWRNEFQRDRDRVIHSSAFRRLEYKTQVFVNHEGDMFRTRLTHSLEVAQIARAVARALSVNEDLVEAIALAHDLGHTPFGHAGQKALNACMADFGGFEHNLHSLRVVDELEIRYPDFNGLNLLFDTREGILKHCRPDTARLLGPLGERFVNGTMPSLEAQIANVCDEIAYNHHDIDDGLRSGILEFEAIQTHAAFGDSIRHCRRTHPRLGGKRLRYAAIRHMMGEFVNDLISASLARITASGCDSLSAVRAQQAPLIDFSDTARAHHRSLKRLLHAGLYRDQRVRRFTDEAEHTVRELFDFFYNSPQELPLERQPPPHISDKVLARAIADYIAGMTDRFAIAEHRRLLGTRPWIVERRSA